jgi:hypothetical protein
VVAAQVPAQQERLELPLVLIREAAAAQVLQVVV